MAVEIAIRCDCCGELSYDIVGYLDYLFCPRCERHWRLDEEWTMLGGELGAELKTVKGPTNVKWAEDGF